MAILPLGLLVSGLFAREELQIDRAFCGAEGSWRDVTAFLRRQVKGDTLTVTLSQPFDEIGGDPAFGQGKKLVIDYSLKGERFRLLLEEKYPIAFEIALPSPDALRPGVDPRAAAIITEAPTHPAPPPSPPIVPVNDVIVSAAIPLALTVLCALLALGLAILLRRRHALWSLFPAVLAMGLSLMGLTGWTPFGPFPQIGYTWSNGAMELSLRSGWLFVIPLLVGGAALVLAGWRYRMRKDAT